MKKNHQSFVFKGIYEFEDPSGALVAAKVPHVGSADLYSGTAVVVRPNQCAFLLYKGQIADILLQGTHQIKTENVPVLTRLANWRFGFTSPLRCEIWFFSSQAYTARRWGTTKPVLHHFSDMKAVPVRAYGQYTMALKDPRPFYMNLIGSRTSFDISEAEEFVQGLILELFPHSLGLVKSLEELNRSQDKVSEDLKQRVNQNLRSYGLQIPDLQVMSMLPSDEIIKAMDAKAAMDLIGNKRDYLLYRAANSLGEAGAGAGQSNDPLQMMMGLMLGKSLIGGPQGDPQPTPIPASSAAAASTHETGPATPRERVLSHPRFCPSCGEPLP